MDHKGCGNLPTATTDSEVKKEENVINILFPVVSLELPDYSRAKLRVLEESIYLVGSIHNLGSRNLIEEHEGDHGESLMEATDMVVKDAPYSHITSGRHVKTGYQIMTYFWLMI